jgi:signal transduction histidine kinase
MPLRREPTDLRALLQSCLALFREQAEALDFDLHIDVADDVPSDVALDRDKIAWAVATLVGNSLRYIKYGTRLMPGGTVEVTVDYDSETCEIVIAVHDDGPGIPEKARSHLLERLPGALHARGLALVLIRDVLQAHGGRMEIASTTDRGDQGTTVTLRFPALSSH